MDRKAKWIATVCLILLLGLTFAFYASLKDIVDVASGSAEPWWPGFPDMVTGTENVTWDFYVVGAYNTTSPPITPAPQPTGFNFTVVDGGQTLGHTGTGPGPVPGGFDFGTLTEYADKGYLSGWGWVEINITNNLGQDIVVTNLTAEVTNGTMTEEWSIPYPGPCIPEECEIPIGNFTLVNFQFFDPYMDEVDYHAGTAMPIYDDRFTDTRVMEDPLNPQLNPWTEMPTGPATLLGPDSGGDAAATGHVAPILLRAGETFNEFFGPGIFGNTSVTTQIRGTITLTLTYRKVVTPSPLDVVDVSMYYCGSPVTEAHITWTVLVNVTVKNTGVASMDMNVSLYGLREATGNITHWSFGNMTQIGTTQLVSLAGGANITLTFAWSLANAPQGQTVPVWTVTWTFSSSFFYYDELWDQVEVMLWGDIDGDGDVDFFDLGKMILIYSGWITEPEWMIKRADLDGDCDVDLCPIPLCYITFFDLGKMILIYSGFL